MKRTNQDRFMFQRGGVWTFKKRLPGQRTPLQVSLNTTDRTLAREKRDEILKRLAADELEQIRGPRLRRVTIGQVLAAFKGVHTLKTVQSDYVQQCLANAYLFLRYAHGERPSSQWDATDVALLFESATFAKFRANYLRPAAGNPERLQSRTRGAAAVMRHVHALFAKDARPLYKHLRLEWRTVDAWLVESRIATEARRHATLEAGALREMAAAIGPLYTAWPDFWLVHTLHKFAGMRNQEIRELRVEWFERAPWGQMFIVCKTRPYYEFKGSDGSIPLHSSLVPLLAKFVEGKAPTDHVLGTDWPDNWRELVGFEGENWANKPDPRAEIVDRLHAAWMRRWTPPEKFSKRGYELRRWAAQLIEFKHGKDAASAFLRHARGSVAERYYLEDWNQWRRLGTDLGITITEAAGETNVEVLGDWQTGAAAFGMNRRDAETQNTEIKAV